MAKQWPQVASAPQFERASGRVATARFGVSRDAVWRHAQAHLSAEMRAALATKLLQREGDTWRIPDTNAAAALSGRLHENLALVAKLTGELVPHASTTITNVLLSPDFQRLRTELMRVLTRYPEARAEVAAVFRQAGLQAATEMGASAEKIIEALPVETEHAD